MVAGGGASVVYRYSFAQLTTQRLESGLGSWPSIYFSFSDTICDLGGVNELANYGEYSGAPSEQQTYDYAKTILSLMTREKHSQGSYRRLFIIVLPFEWGLKKKKQAKGKNRWIEFPVRHGNDS